MTFLKRVLDAPSYGFEREGKFYVPSHQELWSEFFSRLNLFASKKNWLPVFSWATSLVLALPLALFFSRHFSWALAALAFVYSMVILGSHGTFWFHRYSTHRAFKFRNAFFRTLCRNLVIRTIPDEIYVISHHVHHQFSEQPGDPYNVHGGWLYCFLADANHQTIRKDLSERDYQQLCKLIEPTGIHVNSYAQYRKWGSLCHPAWAIGHYLLNWTFWYLAFYWLGGHALATALFGAAGVWAIGVRTFNYEGHGRGKDRRQEGIDFNREDLSVNQIWPGYVSGEWHNNHHLYPNGARAGFLPYQLDLPWLFIRALRLFGIVHSIRDYKADFLRDHYEPYLAASAPAALSVTGPSASHSLALPSNPSA